MSRTFLPHVITDDSALGGAVIERSLRISADSSSYLTRTPSSASNRKTFTLSVWIKRSTSGANQRIFTAYNGSNNNAECNIQFQSDDKIQINNNNTSDNTDTNLKTNRLFRDPTAWYHIVIAVDMTQGTSSNRVKLYVNGEQETSFSTENYGTQNVDWWFNNNSLHTIGRRPTGERYFDGYIAGFNFIDGYQYDPSYFGFTEGQTGIWLPKRYEGTYGTNGFHLEFKDNSSTSTLGKDTSGNQHDFSLSGMSVALGTSDASMIDTPTNNFPTLNPSNRSSGPTLAFGNLYFFYNYKPATKTARSTFRLPKSGKYYWEWENNEASSNPGRWQSTIGNVVNIATNSVDVNAANNANFVSYSYGGSTWNGTTHVSASWDGTTRSWYRPQRAAWAVDCDTGNIWVGRVADDATTQWWASDGSATGNPSKLLNPTCAIDKDKTHEYAPMVCWHEGGAASSTGFAIDVNFGQHAFKGTVPDGFKTLSSANIPPDPSINTIVRPQRHFDILTYTGNNASGRKITGLEFKPDLVWFKKRSGGGQNHTLYDSVRGAGKRLMLPAQSVEGTVSDELLSFDDGGFTIDVDNFQNENAKDYVAWCWKAGGAAVANTDGTLNSQVSVNEEAGFSIVSWTSTGTTGSTIGHGLGKKPDWIILKGRNTSEDQPWRTYHTSVGATGGTQLESTNDFAAQTGVWNDTQPTSSVFTVGSFGSTNENTVNYIAYCWCEVPGFSKFGSYEGNNNSDGPYIHLGFRPAWVMIKNIDANSTEWYILDGARDVDNPVGQYLSASSSASEATYIFYDFLSNGFKLRNTGAAQNPSSQTIIYIAFAEQPSVTPFDTFSNAR